MKLFIVLFTLFMVNSMVRSQGFSSWFPSFEGHQEKDEGQVVVKTGLPPPPPPPPAASYEPKKPILKKDHEKDLKKEHKKVEKKEWVEKCNISFSKDDILMLTMLRRDPYSKPLAFAPILLPPETIQFSFRVEKKKEAIATKKFLKSLAFATIKNDEEKLPISLMLDPKTAALLPVISPDDLFILTIITNKPKKGLKIKSHFVDSISVETHPKPSHY